MGQSLYAPPSVAGWEGGPAWINTTSMLHRTNFALALLSKEQGGLSGRVDAKGLAEKHGIEPVKFFKDLLVQDSLDLRELGGKKDPKDVATLVVASPEYQLA
jgi:hypothetical protein